MIATGLVRRIDDLGRIVIPKEIRRKMDLREGDGLELFMSSDNKSLILQKYETIGEEMDRAIAGLEEAVEHNGTLELSNGELANVKEHIEEIRRAWARARQFGLGGE